jgi:hypothetical protein
VHLLKLLEHPQQLSKDTHGLGTLWILPVLSTWVRVVKDWPVREIDGQVLEFLDEKFFA